MWLSEYILLQLRVSNVKRFNARENFWNSITTGFLLRTKDVVPIGKSFSSKTSLDQATKAELRFYVSQQT